MLSNEVIIQYRKVLFICIIRVHEKKIDYLYNVKYNYFNYLWV